MGTPTLTFDQWQILFHETMAALLRVQESVKQQVGYLGLLNGLWKSSRDLKALNALLKILSETPDGILTDEAIKSHIAELRNLLKNIENLIDAAKSRGLTNRTLTGAGFESIRKSGEYIADYLEALEMSTDPEVLKAIDEGRHQIERGDFEVRERLF
jgi:hypothetical protein